MSLDVDLCEFFDLVARKIRLAQLTNSLMSGVREAHESDEQTLRRVVEEYRACKWEGIPIPGGKTLKGEEKKHGD